MPDKVFTEQFKKLIESGNLSHSYIFYGEDASECRKFADYLASFLETGVFGQADVFLSDLLIVDPNEKGNIGIDEARNLQNFLYQRPVVSKRRTAIISSAESLTDEAQSAILKIVEEPPKDSLIILIAKHPDNMLPTVSSRFQKVYFKSSEEKAKRKKEEGSVDEVDEYFKKAVAQLKKDPKKNYSVLREVLKRYSLLKQYNLNKKLQMKFLTELIKRRG